MIDSIEVGASLFLLGLILGGWVGFEVGTSRKRERCGHVVKRFLPVLLVILLSSCVSPTRMKRVYDGHFIHYRNLCVDVYCTSDGFCDYKEHSITDKATWDACARWAQENGEVPEKFFSITEAGQDLSTKK